MNEIQGVGDVVLGGALAGAAEPATGVLAADGHTAERACLNCATDLQGDYCHVCGQRGHVHRTIRAFFHDLAHGVLHFEGKVWRTLPMLAWCPGQLTRRYIEGQRARYVSPIALFLFAVFLMFAVMGWIGGPGQVNTGQMKAEFQADVAESEAKVATLERERAAIVERGGNPAQIDGKLKQARDGVELERAIARDGARGAAMRVSDDVPAWIAEPLKTAAANPDLMLYKVQNNAYKYSWALIPLSLPFMWLLFPFSRRFRFYDHMVFVTYSLSFMTLLTVVASLAYAANLGVVASICALLPPFHMYRQLKHAYGLGRWGALWRTMLLVTFSVLSAGLFITLLFASGLF